MEQLNEIPILANCGWNELAEAGGYKTLPAGGYVCKIVDAQTEMIPKKGWRATFDVDIVEGEYAGFFRERKNSRGWDFHATFIRYILDENNRATQSFWNFVTCLEKQNPNFRFNPNEKFDIVNFRGLTCGFIFGEYEYPYNGEIKVSVKLKFPELADNIRAGKFKIPPLEKYRPKEKPVDDYSKEFDGENVHKDDMPF